MIPILQIAARIVNNLTSSVLVGSPNKHINASPANYKENFKKIPMISYNKQIKKLFRRIKN